MLGAKVGIVLYQKVNLSKASQTKNQMIYNSYRKPTIPETPYL